MVAQTLPPHLFHYFSSNPPGLRCPVFAARDGARLQKADRVPLALSQFSQRATERPCENWSAAPAAAPCIIHWMRSPPLPLLRLACICRRQRLGCAARPPADVPPALRARPHTGARCPQLLLLLLAVPQLSGAGLCDCCAACTQKEQPTVLSLCQGVDPQGRGYIYGWWEGLENQSNDTAVHGIKSSLDPVG